jgi:hypothetical protein
MTQRDFMLAALQADEDLRPKQVIQFWQQRKTIESAEQPRTYTLPDGTTAEYKVKTAFQYFDDLTDEQLKALTDGYYRELRGSVGMRGFWEWFNRNNPRQRQSLADAEAGKTTGRTRTWTKLDGSTGVYEYKVRPFISWRELRSFVAAQESNQLSRPAQPKTTALATRFTEEQLRPFVRFQLDAIDLSKTRDKDKDYSDYGMKLVFNMIDVYSGYSWQGAARKETGAAAVEFVTRVVGSIKERWGVALPELELKTDNGPSFKPAVFDQPLQQLAGTRVVVRKANSNTPNQMAFVENSNREWRNIARRVLETQLGTLSQGQLDSQKPNASRWHGGPSNNPQGKQLRQINRLMNARQDASRAYESPTRILEAALEPGQGVDEIGQPRTVEQDRALIDDVHGALLKAAAMRRGPSTLKAYRRGDKVRLINAAYLKADLRGNEMKMNPRWSRTVYTIIDKKGTTGAPLKYRVQPLGSRFFADCRRIRRRITSYCCNPTDL